MSPTNEEQQTARYVITNLRRLRASKARALDILQATSLEREALENVWRAQLLRECVHDLLKLLNCIATEHVETYDYITNRVTRIMGERP